MRVIVLVVSIGTSLMTGCSALNVLGVLKPDPKVELGVQVGKENTSNKAIIQATKDESSKVDQSKATKATALRDTSFNTADWNAQEIVVVHNQDQPIGWLYMLLLIAGWVLPDPVSLWHSFIKLFKRKEDEDA